MVFHPWRGENLGWVIRVRIRSLCIFSSKRRLRKDVPVVYKYIRKNNRKRK